MSVSDAISAIQTVLAVGAFIFAYQEFKQWRVETLGNKRIELALRLGRAAFEIQNAFASARSIWGSGSEKKEPDENSYLSETEKYRQAREYEFLQRLKPISEKINQLVEIKWETTLLFEADNEIDTAIMAYRTKMQELSAAMYAYNEHPSMEARLEQMKIIYGYGYGKPGGDDFSKAIEDITTGLRAIARRHTQK